MTNVRELATVLVLLAPVFAQPRGYGAATASRQGTPSPSQEQLFDSFKPANRIDELVLVRLLEEGIPPSEKCSDEVFLRRVHLDVIGTLPTPSETRSFLANKLPDKRAKLIDDLLCRGEFGDYWGLKWGDLLRVKSEFPSNLWPNAVQAYDRWIRDSVRDNKPYDQFARELLTSSGSNFRVPPANFYRAFQERSPQRIAENVALVFMGLRLNDAGLTDEQMLGFSAFFAKAGYKITDEWKEEIVFFKPEGQLLHPKTGKPVVPTPLGGTPLEIAPDTDPRVVFADWLTAPENPWFGRSIVNRTWFWLMGRGIVHEPDDMKPSNPPWSPALLAYLEKELASSKYDLKRIYRLILNSRTYQLSSRPNRWNASDETGFSHYRVRRLDAEPLLDAINQITGSGEKYSSPIPEPFTFLPNDQRAISVADGSIESPFLEMFGRPPRNTSFESERTAVPSVFQAQHLLNSSHIQKKIEQSKVLQQLATGTPAQGSAGRKQQSGVTPGRLTPNVVEDLYIRVLSRFPTDDEKRIADVYLRSPKRTPYEAFCDLVWALMNSKEFVLRH
ncbi:MAG: DUF1553 domain-containing protein [Planctomycetota bacterium]|nr:DUF1553 domain-containing protein [Planctomycetota bacterium]